ncbi:MAG: MBL fold metallo-hydrolase [Polyangiaceae bacterium]|jgi:predicted metal-dependent RNase/dsRNA-specific ribonuclease|nr:MBL fold metallo-hydrolase [Polyangiaceae bacterium]
MTPSLRVSFLGGASAIGASSALVQVADQAVLIDCGVRFRSDRMLPDLEQLTGKHLDAILVTHAHSDHTGALPVVHEAFPAAPIYMTPPTRSLVEILQRDALKLMRTSGEREGEIPLYTERQVESMLGRVMAVHHEASFVLGDIRVTYLPASHILGASMIHLETPAGNVLFTGDYSVGAQRTVPGLARPQMPVDIVFTESTYGNRAHADRKLAEERLLRTIAETVEQQGRVLIPAFAIGRAQEVLLVLRDALKHGRIPRVPILVDGMVRSVCGAYPLHERYLAPGVQRLLRTEGHPFFNRDIRAVGDSSDRRQVASGGPCIVISSSGMLTGGPSSFYASEFAPNERDAILITGYQDEESPGRALLNLLKQQGPRRLMVGGKEVEVKCRFESYSLSAHADRMQMVGLMEALNPQVVGLVHGDLEAKETLARSLGPRETVLAEDGVTLEKVFLRRRSSARKGARPGLDQARAEALVGVNLGSPLGVEALVVAWFGHPVQGPEREAFVQQLLELGVVRRDENDPDLLWSTLRVEDNEEALEEQLRRDNPKGKLLSWCQRIRQEAPEPEFLQEGKGWAAQLSLVLEDRRLESGWQRARNQKVAEQLAAQALMEQLTALQQQLPVRELTPVDTQRLKNSNPKGKLVELCSKFKLKHVVFEQQSHPRGHLRRGVLQLAVGRRSRSSWYLAPSAKEAEQGASEELLNLLWAWKNGTLPPELLEPGMLQGPEALQTKNPKARLNELLQVKKIDGFGFEMVGQKGTIHAPVFEMRAWALRAGERIESASYQATSKREAELQAASSLVVMVDVLPFATRGPRLRGGRTLVVDGGPAEGAQFSTQSTASSVATTRSPSETRAIEPTPAIASEMILPRWPGRLPDVRRRAPWRPSPGLA